MFWSVVRELNRETNIEISDIPKEQISISAFLPRNKNVFFKNRRIHLRKPLKHLCKDCNGALQWKPTRKKHLASERGFASKRPVYINDTDWFDLVDLGSAQTKVKKVPVYNIKRKIMKNTPLSGYKEDLCCSLPFVNIYLCEMLFTLIL